MRGLPHQVTAAEPRIRASVRAGPERTLGPADDRKPPTYLAAAPAVRIPRNPVGCFLSQRASLPARRSAPLHGPGHRLGAGPVADASPRVGVWISHRRADGRLGYDWGQWLRLARSALGKLSLRPVE